MNRRGFSTYTQCKCCGTVVECTDCSIPMVWHSDGKKLKCHYCGQESSFPEECPHCGSQAMRTSGMGTQKIEMLIKELYPDYKVERIDSDILTKKTAHIELLNRFQNGEIDILIGTQIISKGFDFPNLSLVVIIAADTLLGMQDFRADEKAFQLMEYSLNVGREHLEHAEEITNKSNNTLYNALETLKTLQ